MSRVLIAPVAAAPAPGRPGRRPRPGVELRGVTLDGSPAGELRILAAVAAEHGVPLALVTGDDRCCAEALAFAPHVRTARVKTAVDRFSAVLEHPDVTGPRIREAAADAVRGAAGMPVSGVGRPVVLEVEWQSTSMAQACAMVPGVERTGPRTVAFTGVGASEAYRALVVMGIVAGAALDPGGY